MAIADSYVNGQFLEDALNNSVAFDLAQTGASTFNVTLLKENITGQDKNASETLGSGAYATTYECATTGDYTQGTGSALTTPALTSSAGVLKWAEADATMAWTGCTWADGSAPIGLAISDDANANRIICAIKFGSADIPVTSGTLTVTWDAAGIWTATY